MTEQEIEKFWLEIKRAINSFETVAVDGGKVVGIDKHTLEKIQIGANNLIHANNRLRAENERLRKVVECARAFIREDETESATADWVKARNDLQQALAECEKETK